VAALLTTVGLPHEPDPLAMGEDYQPARMGEIIWRPSVLEQCGGEGERLKLIQEYARRVKLDPRRHADLREAVVSIVAGAVALICPIRRLAGQHCASTENCNAGSGNWKMWYLEEVGEGSPAWLLLACTIGLPVLGLLHIFCVSDVHKPSIKHQSVPTWVTGPDGALRRVASYLAQRDGAPQTDDASRRVRLRRNVDGRKLRHCSMKGLIDRSEADGKLKPCLRSRDFLAHGRSAAGWLASGGPVLGLLLAIWLTEVDSSRDPRWFAISATSSIMCFIAMRRILECCYRTWETFYSATEQMKVFTALSSEEEFIKLRREDEVQRPPPTPAEVGGDDRTAFGLRLQYSFFNLQDPADIVTWGRVRNLLSGPARGVCAPVAFPAVNRSCAVLLHGRRAGRSTG
jgi:hypothetical protein